MSILQRSPSINHNRPSTLLSRNPEHDVFRDNVANVVHLMNLFGIDDHCVASLHRHRLFAALHAHVAAQQHKHLLHVFMVVRLKGRTDGQPCPVEHLHLARLKLPLCGDHALEHSRIFRVFVGGWDEAGRGGWDEFHILLL